MATDAPFNWTAEEAAASRDPTDVLWNLRLRRVFVAESEIQGKGLFCAWTTKKDRIVTVAAAVSDSGTLWRTFAGRYINHSEKPNVRLEFIGPVGFLVATRRINPGDEVTIDYRALEEGLVG